MSWRTEHFRSAAARAGADERKRREELRGSSTLRVITSAQRQRWLYGEDGPDAWGFDAFATGLDCDISNCRLPLANVSRPRGVQ
jgi:hypothetical protein